MNRRNFFATLLNPAPTENPVKMTRRRGVRGEQIGLLGYGAMRLPTIDGGHANSFQGGSNAGIDVAAVQRQVDYCLASGMNYFDTAPVYCRGESEKVMGECLSKHPRESWYVATKLSNFGEKQQTFEGAKAMYDASFKNLKTDHIDFYLLHAIGGGGKGLSPLQLFNKRFIDNGMLDFLLKEREAGRIRNLGFSFHGSEAVFRHAISLHDKVKWDFVQIQLNFVDWRHAKAVNARNVNAETLYGLASEKGIPVVVMEPLLGGRLAKFNLAVQSKLTPLDPEATPANWAFRFAGTPDGVLTVLSGMTYMEHIEENVKTYSPLKPLDDREKVILERAARTLISDETIPCTSCDYCMPCPYGLDIPGIFSCWNAGVASKEGLPEDPKDPEYASTRRKFLIDYERAIPKLRRAERCTGCGRCMSHCPQSIDIPAMVRKVDALVEKLRRNSHA